MKPLKWRWKMQSFNTKKGDFLSKQIQVLQKNETNSRPAKQIELKKLWAQKLVSMLLSIYTYIPVQ